MGRHLSVRWKLTLWYAAAYIVTLAIVGTALPPLAAWETNRIVDSQLRSTSSTINASLGSTRPVSGPFLNSQCAGPPAWFCTAVTNTLATYSHRVSHPGQFEQATLFVNGRVQSIGPKDLPRGMVSLELTLPIGETVAYGHSRYLTFTYRGQQVRVYLTPLKIPASLSSQGINGVLEVFQIEAAYAQTSQAIQIILIALALLVLVLAPLAGWWIARAALRPIRRISRTVQTIGSSGDLSRRLDFVGPTDEISRLAETFDEMMDRLEHVFETQKRFVADASHELRTPLTTIRGNADLMRMAPPEDQAACLAAIRREAERMSRMVTDLLLLAESDLAEQPIQKRKVSLDELLDEIYRSAVVLAGDQVTVTLRQNDPVVIDADPDRIKQVLLNLTDNALKFTPPSGTVTLSLEARGDSAAIEVADTGVGIPPEEQEAIFRRFYRVDKARTTAGSGLGLAISAWIVQSHGGSIEVRSRPGQGSTFTVLLPLQSAPESTGGVPVRLGR